MKKIGRFIIFLLLALILMSSASCADFSRDADFFKDKTVTIVVPHGAGGGMDAYISLIAPYLQKYLPGSKVVAIYVPDNGGIAGKNQVFAAQPDGLTLLFTSGAGTLLAEWAGQPDVQYRTAEFAWIGRINAEPHIMAVSPSSGFSQFGDIVKAGTLSMGFAGVSTDDYYVGLVTAQLLGYKVQVQTQFLSTDDASRACATGQVDAIQLAQSSLMPQIMARTLTPIISFSEQRSVDLPELPTILEVVPPDKRNVTLALVQILQLDRNLMAPPNMSPTRLKTLRAALDQAMRDPELLKSMAEMGRPVNYLPGAETEKLLQNIKASQEQLQPLVLQIVVDSK
jgi:tripartite-type tricarboxylate transporter receptor subunit TctC